MYSIIKIGGFALGIAACLLIALYIRDEMSYDRYSPNADRIYRLIGELKTPEKIQTGADWPAPMSATLVKEFPEIEAAGRLLPHPSFYGAGSNEIRRSDKVQNTYEDKFSYADQSMLDMLEVRMIYGDRKKALSMPNSMVISKDIADKYFPHENPVGKTMVINDDNKHPYTIGGVMENFPATSHIQYNFLLSLTQHELWPGEQTQWLASNYYTYILVKPGTDIKRLEDKLHLIITKYYVPAMAAGGQKFVDDLEKNAKLILQRIPDIHLRSYWIDDGLTNGDIRYVGLFGAIACFILLLACINFINLSTAKSANRAKEVGLRKVVGSNRAALIRQFLTESMLFSFLSFILGLLLAWLFLPWFNSISQKSLTIPWTSWWLAPTILISALTVGFVAGIYPSFYLSAFNPIEVLKGKLSRGSRNSVLRNVLVVFQFGISIMLIVGTLVVYHQMQFIMHRDLGYNKDQVLEIKGVNTLGESLTAFNSDLLKLPQVSSSTVSDYLPVAHTRRDDNTFWNEGKVKEDVGISTQIWRVDTSYIKTLGIKIVQGRDFIPNMAADSDAIIINEAEATALGIQNAPLGRRITNDWQHFRVIGVMKDFNFETMKQKVSPLSLTLGNWGFSTLSARIKTADIAKTLSSIGTLWKHYSPNQSFRYTFLDEEFANMYADVQRTGKLFTGFSILAIVIACLGLFALSSFMAEQRSKEISVRKVLGASAGQMVGLLSRNFLRLVSIAFCIAAPLAWWSMNKWLEGFAYRDDISWWIFAVAGLFVLAIAMLTVSFQSAKAALVNPTKGLRSE